MANKKKKQNTWNEQSRSAIATPAQEDAGMTAFRARRMAEDTSGLGESIAERLNRMNTTHFSPEDREQLRTDIQRYRYNMKTMRDQDTHGYLQGFDFDGSIADSLEWDALVNEYDREARNPDHVNIMRQNSYAQTYDGMSGAERDSAYAGLTERYDRANAASNQGGRRGDRATNVANELNERMGYIAQGEGVSEDTKRQYRTQQSDRRADREAELTAQIDAVSARMTETAQNGGAWSPEYRQDDALLRSMIRELKQIRSENRIYERTYQTGDEYAALQDEADFDQYANDRDFELPSAADIEEWERRNDRSAWHTDAQGNVYDAYGDLVFDAYGNMPEDSYLATHTEPQIVDRLGLFRSMSEEERSAAADRAAAFDGDSAFTDIINQGLEADWDELTENEIAVYYTLLGSSGQADADRYLDELTPELNRRGHQRRLEAVDDASALELIGMNVAAIPAATYTGAFAFVDKVVDALKGDGMNPYSGMARGQNFAEMVQEETSSRIAEAMPGKILGIGMSDVYGAGTSMLQSALGASTLGGAYTIVMGMSAASSTAADLYERGATTEQILGQSLIAGLAEWFFEKSGIDNWFKVMESADTRTIGQFLGNIFVQSAREGFEEVGTEATNFLTDLLVMNSTGEVYEEIQNRAAETGEDPVWVGAKLLGERAWHAFAGGAMSGAGMGTISSGASVANTRAEDTAAGKAFVRDGNNVQAYTQFAADLAQDSTENKRDLTRAARRGGKVTQQSEGEMSDRDLRRTGAVVRTVAKDIASRNAADFESVLVGGGMNARDAKYAAEILSVLPETKNASPEVIAELVGADNLLLIENLLNNPESTVNRRQLRAELAAVGHELDEEGNVVTYGTSKKGEVQQPKATADVQLPTTVAAKVAQQDHEVSDDGKTIHKDTGNAVDIVGFEEGKDGKLLLKLSDGTSTASDSISYGSNDEAVVYETVLNMGVSAASAKTLIDAYEFGGNVSALDYAMGIELAYRHGFYGMSDSTDGITESQRVAAYKAGRQDSEAHVQKAAQAVEKKAKKKPSSKRKEGKVHFERGNRAFDDRREASLKMMGDLAKVLGVDFYIFESRLENGKRVYTDAKGKTVKAPNGYYDPSDGSIHIDLNAGNDGKGVMMFTVAHELTHFIKQWSPVKFRTLADFLVQQYGDSKDIDALVAAQQKKARSELTYDQAFEEFVADSMETMLTDGTAVEKLAALQQQDASLADKIRSFIKKFVSKFRAVVDTYRGVEPLTTEGRYVASLTDALSKLEELYAEALYDASENFVRAELMSNEEAFADSSVAILNQIRPPYGTKSKAFAAFRDGLSPDARETFEMFYNFYETSRLRNALSATGKPVKAINISSVFLTPQQWNDKLSADGQWAECAKKLAALLPADVRRNMGFNLDGTLTATPLESEFKMARSLAQRLVDALPFEAIESEYQLGDRTIQLPAGASSYSVGGEAYRRAILKATRDLYDSGKMRYVGIGAMTKDIWGSLGFLATNGKTGASGDLTTLCPQMMYNRGCYYCYRRAAMESGVNNKLVGEKVWYTGEILRIKPEDIDRLNENGGLRIQSFGDWSPQFSAQLADILYDAELRGLQVKIITKEPSMIEYIAALRDQGIGKNLYFNLSADYALEKAPAQTTGDANSLDVTNYRRPHVRIGEDMWWKRAMTIEEADVFRQKYDWVNTRIVATTQEEFLRGLRDPRVDVVTGYHGNIRQWERIDSDTGEKIVNVEALGDAGMPVFMLQEDGTWVVEYEGKTQTHKALAKAIADAGLQFEYYVKTCCITGRCATCKGKCGAMAHPFNVKNATNRDAESVAYWQQNMMSGVAMSDDDTIDVEKSALAQIDEQVAEFRAQQQSEVRYSDRDSEYMAAVNRDDMEAAQRLVDEAARRAGYTIRGNHGTTQLFTIFDRTKGNSEGDFGKGFYFTTNEDDVETNYAASDGGDLTSKIELLADNMEWMDGYEDMDYDERLAEARKMLDGGHNRVIRAALRITNPVVVGGDNETFFDADVAYDEETDEYGEPTGLFHELIDALYAELDAVREDGGIVEDSVDDVINEIVWFALENGGMGAYELTERLKNDIATLVYDGDGHFAFNEVLRAAFERMGLDAIEDHSVARKFGTRSGRINGGMAGVDEDTTHYIVFSPEQIKQTDPVTRDDNGDVIPLSKRFDESQSDIRYSDRDSIESETDINRLRAELDEVEDALMFADEAEAPMLNRRRNVLRGKLDRFLAEERAATSLTPLQTVLDNLELYRRGDLESIAEQLSDGAWDDIEDLSTEELIDGIREMVEGRELSALELQSRRFGVYVREPSYVRFSERDDTRSTREILTDALEHAALTDAERKSIQQYRTLIGNADEMQARLDALNAKIRELTFTKGADRSKLPEMRKRAKEMAAMLTKYDRKLLDLEATAPIRGLINAERKKTAEIVRAEGKEALRKERERSREKQREIIERNKASRANAVERRNRTAMRHKIRNVVDELNRLLLRGDKKSRVMVDLQQTVAAALDAVNMDTVSAERRIAALEAELQNTTDETKRAELITRIANVRADGDKIRRRLDDLRAAYRDIMDSTDPDLAHAYDEEVEKAIGNVAKLVGDTPLRDMTMEQLEAVYDLYTMVLTKVRDSNKAFAKNLREKISTYGNHAMEELATLKGRKLPADKFSWSMFKPVQAFEFIGSRTMEVLFNNVRKGEDVWATDIQQARAYKLAACAKYGFDSWDFYKQYDFESKTGRKFKLTLQEMMSLYAYSKRGEQAIKHLENGGFTFDESDRNLGQRIVDRAKGKKEWNAKKATAFNVSRDTLDKIIATLSPQQRAFADEMQDYLSTVMGAKGNEVSVKMYGVKLFTEKHYFPLHSSEQFMERVREQNSKDGVKLRNAGFTQATIPESKNAVVLSEFMDVWSDHVNEMSMYHAFVLPLEDFYRVYNFRVANPAPGEADISVVSELENRHGKGAVAYVDQLLRDINGGGRSDPNARWQNAMVGKFKKAAVFASLSVVVQQPSAVARAFAVIDPKYFVGENIKGRAYDRIWDEVKHYAPVAFIKEMGYFDTNMGQSTRDYLKAAELKTFRQKAKAVVSISDSSYRDELFSKLPALADEMTWCWIWNACKRETAAKYNNVPKGSEEFMRLVGQRFTEVITKTQVYDSVLSRSQMMRSKDGLVKAATAFMAEPTTTLNMMVNAIAQKSRGRKGLGRTSAAVATSLILNALLVALPYAMRDDDEDETFGEKYVSSFLGSLLDGLNPFTYIPIIKDVWSRMQGYDVERADMSLVSDILDGWEAILKRIENDEPITWKDCEKFFGSIANAFGLPLKNISRDIRSIVNTIDTVKNGEDGTKTGMRYAIANELGLPKLLDALWGISNETPSNADQLYEAMISDDIAHQERVLSRFKDDRAAENAIRRSLRENDERIAEAAVARREGDMDTYADLVAEIVGEGHFSEGTVVAAVNAAISAMEDEKPSSEPSQPALFTGEDYFSSILRGDNEGAKIVKDYLIEQLVEEGNLETEAEKSVANSFSTKVLNAYEEGTLDRQSSLEYLTLYGGKNESEAEKAVLQREFKLETGYSWSARDNAYRLGAVSDNDLVDWIMRVEGKDEADAIRAVLRYDFINENPEYSDITTEQIGRYYSPIEDVGYSLDDAGIPMTVYGDYCRARAGCDGEKDANGDTIRNSVKNQVLQVIDALPLSPSQKDALYFFNGWARKNLYQAPWH